MRRVRFVADQLEALDAGTNPDADGHALPAGMAGSLNTAAMGIYGHSFGGATAAAVLATDSRFVGGIDLDGFIIGPTATAGLSKPFLVVAATEHDTALDPSWATFLPALQGWREWLRLANSGHYRFMDLGGSPAALGLSTTLKARDPTTWAQVFGDIDDASSQVIVRDLVSGFFNQFLRGKPSATLSDPTGTLPELEDLTPTLPSRTTK